MSEPIQRFLHNYYAQNKKIPNAENLSKFYKKPLEEAKQEIYDFIKRVKTSGTPKDAPEVPPAIPQGAAYLPPTPVSTPRVPRATRATPPEPAATTLKGETSFEKLKKSLSKIHDLPTGFIRVASALISLVILVRSFGYVLQYMQETDHTWLAYVTSLAITAFVFLAPQITVASWRAKLHGLFVVMGLISVILIVVSAALTVNGLYMSRSAVLHETTLSQSESDKASNAMTELKAEIETKNAQILSDTQTITEQLRAQQKYTDRQDGYWIAQKNIDSASKEKSRLQEEVTTAQGKLDKMSAVVVAKPREDFFTWVGGIFKVPASIIEFIVAVLLAAIIDIAAPILGAISLFWTGKKGEKNA